MICLFKRCKKEETQAPKLEEKKPSKPKLDKAEEISKQYAQLEKCCSILSRVEINSGLSMYAMYSRGWRVDEYTLEGAGIDIEEVYDYIKLLANKRKTELEATLSKVSV